MTNIIEVSPPIIRMYLADLATYRNQGGIHFAYRPMKTFFRWTWDEFDINLPNPIDKVKVKRPLPTPIPGATVEDVRKLLATCTTTNKHRDQAIILLLFDSGLRAAELLALQWRDIDLLTGSILVKRGKGGQFRHSFAGKHTRRILRAYFNHSKFNEPSDYVFISQYGQPLKYHGLREILRRRANAANIPMQSPHDFRRGMLLEMLRNEADEVSTSRIAGHSTLEMTKRYQAQLEDDLRRVHAKASPVDNARL